LAAEPVANRRRDVKVDGSQSAEDRASCMTNRSPTVRAVQENNSLVARRIPRAWALVAFVVATWAIFAVVVWAGLRVFSLAA
jgi:hypothetical protein